MVTATATRPVFRSTDRDRIFYSGMAIAMAVTVFVGFSRTYYLSAHFGRTTTVSGSPFTTLIHIHAVLFTTWVVLFIVQTALVATHRVAIHKRLGIFGGVLAAGMICLGTAAAIHGASVGSAPPGVDPLSFLAIPLGDMTMFATFIITALWWRRDKERHKRLMLLAYISLLAAAVARWPGVLPLGPFAFYGFAFLFLVAGMIYDFATRRRVHPAYLWGGGLLVLSVPLRLVISGTHAWHSFAEFLTGR